MILIPNTVMFSADNADEYITKAREYIKEHNLTAEDVKLIRKESGISVITKREINFGD